VPATTEQVVPDVVIAPIVGFDRALNVEMKQPAPAMEIGLIPALEAQISALKEVGSLLKEQLEDTRKDRDAWRTQAESNQRLLVARPRRRGFFGWRTKA
jgi:hypothetical protein